MQYPKVPKDILPTLVIGLGGTGYQVIKRLKQLFNKRYNNEKLPIRYLLVDTDLKTFLDDNVRNSEKCQLRFGEGIKSTLDWAYSNPNFDWLPQNPKITPDFFTSTDQGAGLVRPIGRLYLCKNAKLVYDNLQTAKNDLVDLHKVLIELGESYLENIDRHKVYIVGSLAGGTGCGTFLDVAVMVSKIFNRDNTNIIGMFTLESCYDDKLSSDLDAQNRSKANCYAALKELEFYMSSITNQEDKKYTFNYSNVGEIKLDRKLLDICYLVENKNETGGVLTNIEDIYDLCSLQLFQEVGTTLGSQLRADYANFICKDKDPVLKKDRHFSTFSSSSMEFPAENLKRYCSYMLSRDILEKLSSEAEIDGQILNDETDNLINAINSKLEIDSICEDFTEKYKIEAETKDFTDKKENLEMADDTANSREKRWKEIKVNADSEIDKILSSHINEYTVNHGIKFARKVLESIKTRLNTELEGISKSNSIDRATVEKTIDSLPKNDKPKKNKKDKNKNGSQAEEDIVNSFNLYIDQVQNRLKRVVYSDRLEAAKNNIKNINDKIDILVSRIGDMINDISIRINKIDTQSIKKYGGNIVSREMISKDFYIEFYNSTFKRHFTERIKSMFENKSLIDVVEQGSSELIGLCEKEYDKVDTNTNLNIIEVLKRNAKEKKKTLNDYTRDELNVTSKLARPFWSAVKNPEVSWTECYYIGCIKDEDINNGFTIKAPDAIDNWIRNQTGERSRWARYVETTNPYSIDVIHITMGACAAYLPDIRNYRLSYLRFLSSETYPVHLHQDYIGLEELDKEMEDMFRYYSLAKAFGAILQVGDKSYLNIKKEEDKFKYIFESDYCLIHEDYPIEKAEMPENETLIESEMIKLGNGYHETIKGFSENNKICFMIKEFIKDAESKFKRDDIKKHCEKYLKDSVSDNKKVDFIAKQKIDQRVIAS